MPSFPKEENSFISNAMAFERVHKDMLSRKVSMAIGKKKKALGTHSFEIQASLDFYILSFVFHPTENCCVFFTERLNLSPT